MATIKPRRGTTTPTTGLVQNELAVDTTNKRIYIGNSGGGGDLIGSAPGGSNTQVQFNDSGNLGGDAGLTYDKTTDTLTSGSISTTGLEVKTVGGDEGGQIDFGIPATNTTLSSGVAIDIYQNRLRMFEKGGTARGVYIDLTSAAAGVSTNLLASSASPGGSDTYVQFNDGGSAFGGDAGLTYNKTTDSLTITGDLAVNGGDVTTTSATATLFNTNATTLSIGGAATTFNVGYSGSSTHTINIGTTALGSAQIKTINLGTGSGNSTRTANINIGSAGGATYLNSPYVYIGDNSGSAPSTLAVDTINPYTSLGSITMSAFSSTINIDTTGDIFIGDTQGSANSTSLNINDSTSSIAAYAGGGFTLSSETELRFQESLANGSNYVGFKAPASLSANKIWTLPSADGTSGQVLTTDGSGTLSWATASGGSSATTVGAELALFNLGII